MGRHLSLNGKETDSSGSWTYDTEDSSDSGEVLVDLLSSSPVKSPCWPQSFGKSMNLYSRSPSIERHSPSVYFEQDSVLGSALPCQQQAPAIDMNDSAGLKEPLLTKALQKLEDGESYMERPKISSTNGTGTVGLNEKEHNDQWSQLYGSSVLQATLNGMNILAGVGILSMPYAVSQGGWLGLGFLLLFGVVCCYTGVLLCRCLDTDPQLSSYPDIGHVAFGQSGRFLVSLLLYFELYAVAVEFLILEGDNLTQLFPWEGLDLGGIILSSQQAFVVLSALVMLPTVWLRDLSLVAYVSAGGVAACIVVLLAVGWVGFFDVGFNCKGQLLNLNGLPVAVGLYAFCFCGHAVFPNIYTSMKDRTKFSLVLIVCFILCTLIYGGIAVLGFLMFGNTIQSQVTLNLSRETVATKIAIFATLVSPFAKYALTITPLAAALEEFLPLSSTPQTFIFWGTVIRTLLVASTVVVALTVPFFAYLMAFIGSFLSTTVAIIIPCVCYLKIFTGRVSSWEMSLIIFFILVGLTACVAGTYSSVRAIIISLSN